MNRPRQDPAVYEWLRLYAGNCPNCAAWGRLTPFHRTGVVYRLSARSVTFRCNHCGLQWTVTLHQFAKAARRWADEAERGGSPDAGVLRMIADHWPVDETRGRKPGVSSEPV